MLNSMQGVDILYGGFAAGMNAIRARNDERDNIAYYAGRCREMEEWGEKGWNRVEELRAENNRLRAANVLLTKRAVWAERSLVGYRELLPIIQRDADALRQEIERLKRRS